MKRLGNGNAWAANGNYDSACMVLDFYGFYSMSINVSGKRHNGIAFRCGTIPDGLSDKYNNVIVGNGKLMQAPEITSCVVFVSNSVIHRVPQNDCLHNKAEVK